MRERESERRSVHVVTNRRQGGEREYVTHLLRRSYREGGKVKKETVANISSLPDELVDVIRRWLRGERFVSVGNSVRVERSLPHGHVAAALAVADAIDLRGLLDGAESRERDLALALVVERAISPGSDDLVAGLSQSTLGDELGVSEADADDARATLTWIAARAEPLERALARRHLAGGAFAFYVLTRGVSGDGSGLLHGLFTDAEGRPLAADIFPHVDFDARSLARRVSDLGARSNLWRIVLVAEQDLLTPADLSSFRRLRGIGWITPQIGPEMQRLGEKGVSSAGGEIDAPLEIAGADAGERIVALVKRGARYTCVVRTNLAEDELDASATAEAFLSRSKAGRAFRDLCGAGIGSGIDPEMQGALQVCLLSAYLEWHLRRAWTPLLAEPTTQRASEEAFGTHTYRSLVRELSLLARTTVTLDEGQTALALLPAPTPLQARALALAGRRQELS